MTESTDLIESRMKQAFAQAILNLKNTLLVDLNRLKFPEARAGSAVCPGCDDERTADPLRRAKQPEVKWARVKTHQAKCLKWKAFDSESQSGYGIRSNQ